MLHPYIHQLLHKNDLRDRLKEIENDQLVQLVTLQPSQLHLTEKISMLITQWWTNRWTVLKENRRAEGKIVMPEA